MTRVASGVDRLEDVCTNWYLLEDGGRLTLVDAGCLLTGQPSPRP
jgi:hypothetical protein